jgi:DMSO/TMAO reductase YedYZ molybdopterin-dependent catalytic subunit
MVLAYFTSHKRHITSREISMILFPSDGNRKQLENQARSEGRLPPGQSLTLKWPVLHYGSIPHFDESRWDFKISGEVAAPLKLSWKEFRALPQTEVISDFHCVTRWSRLDNAWKGVLFTEVLKLVSPTARAKQVLVLAEEGYTANVPLADLLRPNVLFAFDHDGQPLTAEHGGPCRLIVSHLYAWKSVKWVRGFTLLDQEQLGFWERNGYHAYGDPWQEQRYSGT